jgi:glycosyltransferase involved in cell wall biosynthesis
MEEAPLRVALLSYRSLPTCGGQGVYLRHLSRELTRLGHTVDVFSGPPYPLLDPGVRLVELPGLDLWGEPNPMRWPHPREIHDLADLTEFVVMRTGQFSEPLAFSLRVAGAVRAGSADGPKPYDIVHDNQSLGYGLLGLRRSLRAQGIPVVSTIHHPITVDRRLELAAATGVKRRYGLRRWYSFLPMQARVGRRLDGVLTVSSTSAEDIQRDMGIPASALHTVPLGVDQDVFQPDPSAAVPGRIVVVTSADVPLKGLGVLLDALARIRVDHDAHLVCIGKAKEGGIAARRVSQLGLADAVTFRSDLTQEELVRVLQSAEIAVVPSLYEGFSLPAVEEMACGLPLVATTAGALPEVAGPDGEAALLVPPGDHGALAVAVGKLLDDPGLRARLGAAGRARVLEGFSWSAATTATADWYRERIAAVRSSGPS